jgi:hypothetical protein
MPGRIRIKTADLLSSPGILAEAKTLCEQVCLDRDLVLFEPREDQLLTLVVMLSNQNISYSLDFSMRELDKSLQVLNEISTV